MSLRDRPKSDALKAIFAALPKLTADELEEVRTRIAVLRGLSGPVARIDTPSGTIASGSQIEHIVLEAIRYILMDNGVLFSVQQATHSPAYPSFKRKLPDIQDYVYAVSTRRIDQQAIVSLGIDLMYSHLFRLGIPVGARVLMTNVHRMSEFINRAFPGYARAGTLSWIISHPDTRRSSSTRT